jgi:hypothetical protein
MMQRVAGVREVDGIAHVLVREQAGLDTFNILRGTRADIGAQSSQHHR